MSFLGSIFGKSRAGAPKLAAIDVGSSAIRALGFTVTENGKALVKSQSRVPFQERLTGRKRLAETGYVKERLKTAFGELGRDTGYEAVAASLGESFFRGVTFHAVFERQNPKEKVDLGELKNLIEKAEWEARREVEKKFFIDIGDEHKLSLVDSRLLGFSVDGYGIADPVGLAGRELEINLFNTYAEQVAADFLDELQKHFRIQNFLPASPLYAVCRVLASQESGELFSGILIDIGDYETSIALAIQGRFMGIKTFAIGGNAFARRIGLALGLDPEAAEQTKKQYAARELSPAVTRKISALLKSDVELWTRSLGLALEGFAASTELYPSRFYLFGGSATLPGLAEALETQEGLLKMPFLEKRTATVVSPSLFTALENTENLPATTADTGVYAIACLLMEERRQQSEPKRLVRRAIYLANQ